jgi:hypothetical protein
MGIGINESDMVDTATRQRKDGTIDGGFMGVHYPSVFTRGVSKKDFFKLPVNIRIGFDILMASKDVRKTVVVREPGKLARAMAVGCPHHKLGHEWWLHYNNGPGVSKDKFHAAYDYRVAAIYQAVSKMTGETPREIEMRRTYDKLNARTRRILDIIDKASAAIEKRRNEQIASEPHSTTFTEAAYQSYSSPL